VQHILSFTELNSAISTRYDKVVPFTKEHFEMGKINFKQHLIDRLMGENGSQVCYHRSFMFQERIKLFADHQ